MTTKTDSNDDEHIKTMTTNDDDNQVNNGDKFPGPHIHTKEKKFPQF